MLHQNDASPSSLRGQPTHYYCIITTNVNICVHLFWKPFEYCKITSFQIYNVFYGRTGVHILSTPYGVQCSYSFELPQRSQRAIDKSEKFNTIIQRL